MRTLMTVLLALGLSVSAFAGYDYVISSGYVPDLTLTGSQSLLMTGGGGNAFTAIDSTLMDIRNTSSPVILGESGIRELLIGGTSQLKFSGGSVNNIYTSGDATVILSGGQIGGIQSWYAFPANPNHVMLFCNPGYQLTYTGNVVTKISGTWLDGNAFSIKLYTYSGYSDMFSNMTIIPEPATMLLLGLGGVLLRRRK